MVNNIFNTVKNFKGNCFQGKRKLLKILNVKSIFNTVSEKFQGNSFFSGQAQVAQKSWTVKKCSIQCIFTWGQSVHGLV